MKAQRVDGGIAPPVHNCGTRKGWEVSATPWPLYPQERDPLYRKFTKYCVKILLCNVCIKLWKEDSIEQFKQEST